jgi:quinohemoprotein ethanol dehydrogenase
MSAFARCLTVTAAGIAFVAISTSGALAQDAKGSPGHIRAVTAAVDDAAIKAAGGADNKDWLTYGLNYAETRFSKLKQITTENVKQLG